MGIRLKRSPLKFTEDYIQQVLERRYMTNPLYVAFNLHVFPWESDFLLCTKAYYWYEVEIKISLSDFKNDFKHKAGKYYTLEHGTSKIGVGTPKWVNNKPIYNRYEKRYSVRPHYFSYCVPYFLVEDVKKLLPPFAGLCYVTEYGSLEHVYFPKQLHKEKYTDKDLNLTNKFYYAYRNWRTKSEEWVNKEKELKSDINFVKAEYKAALGYPIEEIL